MSFPESPYIVGGLVVGGIYAIFVLGLVLTYKSSRIFNFAHGAIAYFVAATYHSLNSEYHWSIVPAAVVSILVIAPLTGLFLWAVLFRQLTRSSATVRVVATIGLFVAIPELTIVIWGDQPFIKASGLAPEPLAVFHPFGVGVNADQIAVVAAAVVLAIAMTLLLRFTTFGLQVRGTVDAPTMAGLTGTNTALVSAGSWMIGTMTAGLAGVLLAPILGLDPSSFTLLLIASFAAVVIARLTSLPMAFAGAMLIGLAQEISVKYLPENGVLSTGFRPSLPFIIMAVFLLAHRGGREQYALERVPSMRHLTSSALHAPLWQRLAVPALVLAAALLVPGMLSSFWLGVVGTGIALGILFLSSTVVTGEGGMISLCQITFAGIGAIASAQLIGVHGWAPIPGLIVGALFAVPFGIAIAIPVLRLGGVYVALATLTFGLLIENLVFPISQFGISSNGVNFQQDGLRPMVLGVDMLDDKNYYYAVFIVFAVCAIGVAVLRRSTLGLKMAATRTSEPASATIGISTARAKIAAFGISAFLAGLGGTMFALYSYKVTPSLENFGVIKGLLFFAVMVTWGTRSTAGALFGGVAIAVFPEILTENLPIGGWQHLPAILFGLGAIVVAREPRGIVVQTAENLRRLGRGLTSLVTRPPAQAVEGTGVEASRPRKLP